MNYSLQILEWIEDVTEEYREYKKAYDKAEDILKVTLVLPSTYLERRLARLGYRVSNILYPYDYDVGLDVYSLKKIILNKEDYKFTPYVDKILATLKLLYAMNYKSIESKEYLQRTREDVMPLINLYLLTKDMHISEFKIDLKENEVVLWSIYGQGNIKVRVEEDRLIFLNGVIR